MSIATAGFQTLLEELGHGSGFWSLGSFVVRQRLTRLGLAISVMASAGLYFLGLLVADFRRNVGGYSVEPSGTI
jgi:hypothetical protein